MSRTSRCIRQLQQVGRGHCGVAAIVCGAFVALLGPASAQESAPATSQEMPTDLSITGLDRPIRVRLTVTVDGSPWAKHFEDIQGRYLQALLTQLDGDQDGTLSPGEAGRLPAPRSWATLSAADDVHVAFNFRVLDADGDEKVSTVELDRYVRFFGNVSMRLMTVGTRQPNDDLFRFLDANRDRVLQAGEWSTIAKLVERDRDGNRVLTTEELRGPMPVATPPEFVAASAGAKTARQPLKLELTVADGALPDAEFTIDYSGNALQARRPRVQLKVAESAGDLSLKAEQAANEPVLLVGGRRIVLRVPPPTVRERSALRRQLQSEFDSVAEESEQIVAASSAMPPHLKSVFRIADRNDDGQLERPELERYMNDLLSFQVAADAARLRLVQSGERRGLMPLVDGNLDGRLSRRELQTLPEKLTMVGGSAAEFTRQGLAPTIVLVLQHGPFSEALGDNPLENAGPPWFYRADRNQDGDLDREEFLGTAEDFLRLDTNGDGWIDLDEAVLGDPGVPATDPEGKQ